MSPPDKFDKWALQPHADAFITIAFDTDGIMRDRAVLFGSINDVTRDLVDAARGPHRGFPLGGFIVTSPRIGRAEIMEAVHAACVLPFPASFRKLLSPQEAALWCSDAWGSGRQEGPRLTGPTGSTRMSLLGKG